MTQETVKEKINNLNKEEIVALDFFCSAGGVTCGFQQAGINVLGGLDIDKSCKETYEKNNNAKFLNVDVSQLPKEELGNVFDIEKNQDNLLFVGCSPCQYFSNIKTDKTKSSKSRLLLADFQEFVDYYRPGHIFIENVPGLKKNKTSPLEQFKKFLTEKGYYFDDAIINVKNFGVPQSRRRYILIASRIKKDIKIPIPDKGRLKTVKETIGDKNFFKPISAGTKDKSDFMHSAAALSSLNLERIQNTPLDGGDRRAWKDNPKLQLECYKNHKGHWDVYSRMYWDRPSPTITTRFCSLSNGRYGHPDQDRAISLREGATLQSFPLNYTFYSESQGTIAKMIGNAVPPEFARRIAKAFFKTEE